MFTKNLEKGFFKMIIIIAIATPLAIWKVIDLIILLIKFIISLF